MPASVERVLGKRYGRLDTGDPARQADPDRRGGRMRTRWTAVAVGVLAVLGLGVAPARAADAPGTTTFSTTIPVHCSEGLSNPPNEYDTTVVEAGTNPVAVTLGARLQVDFTRLAAPGALGADDRVLVLQVWGPVTP